MNSSRAILGIILILAGGYLFINKGVSMDTGDIFAYFWASMFVIPLGVFFHWMYFSMTARRATGLLIPGGILLVAGIVCQISMLFDLWHVMWPGFPLAVAFGLAEFYWFGSRNKWLLIPIYFLGIMSFIFFVVFSAGTLLGDPMMSPILAVVLIAIGLLLVVGKKRDVHM